MTLAFIYIIAYVISGIVWGYAVRAVIRNKGYDADWFWWGFFFEFIALIVALTKPDLNYINRINAAQSQPQPQSQQKNGNAAYVPSPAPVTITGEMNPEALLKRGFIYLEDQNWRYAHAYFDKVLDYDPECAMAYVGKLLSEIGVKSIDDIPERKADISDRDSYKKACRFADDELKKRLEDLNTQSIYNYGVQLMKKAVEPIDYEKAADVFRSIRSYEQSEGKISLCMQRKNQYLYDKANSKLDQAVANADPSGCIDASKAFEALGNFGNAAEMAEKSREQAEKIKLDIKNEAIERKKRLKKTICVTAASVAAVVVAITGIATFIDVDTKYKKAVALYNNEKYATAIYAFIEMNGFNKSEKYIDDAVQQLIDRKKYDRVIRIFQTQDNYENSQKYINMANEAKNEDTYITAEELLESKDYEKAINAFKQLGDYKDSKKKLDIANEARNEDIYITAEALLESKDYEKAINAFKQLGDYRDSKNKLDNIYNIAIDHVKSDNFTDLQNAYNIFTSLSDYKDSAKFKLKSVEKLSKTARKYYNNVAVGSQIVGLKTDGTVVVTGDHYYNASVWKDIIAVSAGGRLGNNHTVGLKSNGTVVAKGDNNTFGECDVSDWKDIIAISAGIHTVGLKAYGTVVAVGYNSYGQCSVSHWKDIIAVSAGEYHTVGLKADGTVVATGVTEYGQCNVFHWKDIIAVSAGEYHTVGLKADGTVIATGGYKEYGQCDVSDWEDIIAVSAGENHTVGLKADGTVVATGDNNNGQCDVSDWEDIIAVYTGYGCTVGLKADGTVVTTGDDYYVSKWTNIGIDTAN